MKPMLVAFALLAGCATMQEQADHAFASGDFGAADQLYGKLGESAKQALARTEELRVELAQATLMPDLEVRAGKVADVLARRQAWQLALEPRLAADLQIETMAVATSVDAEIARRTAVGGPLVGEAAAHDYAAFLARPEVAATAEKIHDALLADGEARCELLDASTPFESWIVSRYCAHFGITRPAQPLPGLYGSLTIDGSIAGPPARTSALAAALVGALKDSIWYAPGAPALPVALDGHIAATFASKPVERTATWHVSVPYTALESTYESYDETYVDTETTTTTVPDTGTNPDGSPATGFHTETRTEPVTKTRTAWHWVEEPVTKYRDELRSFTYAATEHDGHYASVLDAQVAALGVAAHEATTFDRTGDDTDASDADAGVSPTRANLPTEDNFAATEQATLAGRFTAALDTAFRKRNCSAATYSVEAAATCAFLDPGTAAPPEVHASLEGVFGAEEPLLAPLLRH